MDKDEKDKNEKEEEIASLWRLYGEKHEVEVRNQLMVHYLELVNTIAGRVAIGLPPHVDKDDLISSGYFGLMDAVERYDYTRNNKFETYAGMRIRGAMLDYLRSKDWIPNSLRQKIRSYERTVAELETELGRTATDQEVAERLGIELPALYKLLRQMSVATIMSLDEYIASEREGVSFNPSERVEKQELKQKLADVISRLPEKEKIVVSLYYYEKLTMKEISLVMHITEARVCQLHAKAMLGLRTQLAGQKQDLV